MEYMSLNLKNCTKSCAATSFIQANISQNNSYTGHHLKCSTVLKEENIMEYESESQSTEGGQVVQLDHLLEPLRNVVHNLQPNKMKTNNMNEIYIS